MGSLCHMIRHLLAEDWESQCQESSCLLRSFGSWHHLLDTNTFGELPEHTQLLGKSLIGGILFWSHSTTFLPSSRIRPWPRHQRRGTSQHKASIQHKTEEDEDEIGQHQQPQTRPGIITETLWFLSHGIPVNDWFHLLCFPCYYFLYSLSLKISLLYWRQSGLLPHTNLTTIIGQFCVWVAVTLQRQNSWC